LAIPESARGPAGHKSDLPAKGRAAPSDGRRYVASSQRVRAMEHANIYVGMMFGEFAPWAYDEERAPAMRGAWRERAFGVEAQPARGPTERRPLDLEIGTGNGVHFSHRAASRPERLLVGLELKFKPLVQSIRRAVRAGSENARIARYDAESVAKLFVEGEIDDVFIHFPDPWPKKRNWKNRLVNERFLSELHRLQAPGSVVEFKTDSQAYFDWAMERIPRSPYRIEWATRDLGRSDRAELSFVTHFEGLFRQQGLPIYAALLARD
jgi:tRNA (guanine-N7-)-methyltransferase